MVDSRALLTQSASIAICVCLLLGMATPVAADSIVIGEPNISASTPEPVVEATSAQSVQVVLVNDGEIRQGNDATFEQEVQRAKNVQVELQDNNLDAPIEVKSGKRAIGTIADGQRVPLEFNIEIGDAEPGTYQVPVVIEYTHTRSIIFGPLEDTERKTRSQEIIRSVTIEVEDKPQFKVTRTANSSVVAGDNNVIDYTIENTGTREATDVETTFETTTDGTFFGKAANPSQDTVRSIGSLAPGESTTTSIRIGAGEDVDQGRYPVLVTTEFENRNGITETADTERASFVVQPDRSFTISNIELNNFRVDEPEATFRATITNEGPAPAQSMVVRISEQEQLPLTVTSGGAAVGDLAVGESSEVSFTVNIPEEAEPGSISIPLTVEYENNGGDILRPSTPLRQRVVIAEERDRFQVVNTNTTVTPGGSGELTTTLKYTGDDTVSNANIKLFTNDPLSSSDDGAYLGTIEPGESVTATFQVSASGSALAKEYTSSVEVRYDEPDGDTRFTGSLTIGVPIMPSSSSSFPLSIAAVVGTLALVGGAIVVYRR